MNTTIHRPKHSFFNPFLYIAGFRSLFVGVAIIFVLALLAYLSGTHYLALILPVFSKDAAFVYYLCEHLIHWWVLSILLFTSGSIYSKSRIRSVDVVGTQAIALIPLVVVPLIRFLPPFETFWVFSIQTAVLYGVHVAMAIWSVTLMFNAYKVTCNVKQHPLVISFIISLFLTQIITIVLISIFKNNIQL